MSPSPENDPCTGKVVDIDIVLEKLRAASRRVGFNLWHIFKEVDDYKTNYIPEPKFLSVLLGPLKNIIGLDIEDITLLVNKFKAIDGRIAYTQICRLVHENEQPPMETKEDQDREYAYTSNTLSPQNEERVAELLTQIASKIPPQRMILKPFFQDYELMKRGSGQLSRNTFSRILAFLGIQIPLPDFQILFEKYRYDAFTIKYNAFLKDLNGIYQYLIDHGHMDISGNYLADEASGHTRIQPKPELKPAPRGEEYGIARARTAGRIGGGSEAVVAFNKARDHVLREKIRVGDYFKHFDEDDEGRVPKQVMEKFLSDWLCISETSFNSAYFAPREISLICTVYQDPNYKDKVLWKLLMDDLERGIPEEELKTWPCRGRERYPMNPFEVLHRPHTPPDCMASSLGAALEHIKDTMEEMPASRKLISLFNKYMRDTDSEVIPHRKFEWGLIENGIQLSDSEREQIRSHYGTREGIDWTRLSSDLRELAASSSFNDLQNQLKYAKEQAGKCDKVAAKLMESNIVEVLAKVKRNAICKRIWLRDSLKPFDKLNKQLITANEFQRGLDICGIKLTDVEMQTVLEVFALPENPSLIEYERFCRTVDEDSLPPCLIRFPLKEAMVREEEKHTTALPQHQWANFESRIALGNAMDKLAKYVTLANTDFFKSIDKSNKGTVSRLELQGALHKLNCLHLITNRELDCVISGFGVVDGLDVGLDYMSFLRALDIINKKKKAAKTS